MAAMASRAADPLPAASDPAQASGIAVDIRFVLWLLGTVDAAEGLLDELVVAPAAVDAG